MMRTTKPSASWYVRWLSAYQELGGFMGAATVEACWTNYAKPLYVTGASARVAAWSALTAGKLHSDLGWYKDIVNGLESELELISSSS